MVRRTFIFKVKDDASADQVKGLETALRDTPDRIPVVLRGSYGKNLGQHGGWTHVWDFDVARLEDNPVYVDHPHHKDVLVPFFSPKSPTCIADKIDYGYYQPLHAGVTQAKGGEVIRRVMFYRIGENASDAQKSELDERLLELPKHVSGITNWALNEVTQSMRPDTWSHVWELEFADDAGLQQYSDDPFHLDEVAPYFRPDSAKRIVDEINIVWYRAAAPMIAVP